MDQPTFQLWSQSRVVASLQKTLAIGLLLALASFPTPGSAVEPSTDHDVVIVGAGAAGLYAAYTLDNLGYSVIILEATDRHGGRVYSDTLGDVGIEHGAEELYGTTNNFVFNDIKGEYGNSAQVRIFRETPTQDDLYVMDADGMGGGSTCWSASGDCDADPDIVHFWDYYEATGDYDDHPTDELVSDFLDNTWGVPSTNRGYHLYEGGSPGGEYGTTVERLGLRSLSREWNAWSLSDTLYGLAPTGYLDALNTLYFDHVIPYVTYNSPITVIDTGGLKPVAIDANGVYHYAESIIVTVSVGVLKAEIIDFIPDLPAAKLDAINTIGMGKGMKISLRFSSQIWESKMMYVLLDGPTASCWPPNVYQSSATDFVLTCFIMGRNAEIMAALPDDNARINQALVDIDVALGGAASTGFLEGIVRDWTAEPYVLGSYSYPAPGTRPVTGPTKREVLAQPVGTTLYFAGEATHNTAASTVPGALQTGERAGGEVDSHLGGPPAAGAPKADFSASVTAGVAPLDVSFTDLSTQLPTDWSWEFGDGSSSPDQHPIHQYTTPGDYTVSLTVTNPNGSHTRVLPKLISVTEAESVLTLIKEVINDSGGLATASDWTLTADGPTGFSGSGPSVSSGTGFAAGSYDLSESGGPAAYSASDWVCVGGTQDDTDTITLNQGESATCTISNDDIDVAFQINTGHAGAWFNTDTSGQGQFIDVEPKSQFMFISWFTYTDAASANPFEQHWFTAQGNYSGNTAVLDLFETLGGRFDDPQMVTNTRIGEVTLSFDDCGHGQMAYSLDEGERVGEFPLVRVIPGSGNLCEDLSGNATQAVDINAGMDGAWFDPNSAGQGFFIDAHPDPEGGNFIFVSWFTYGQDTASGQRWLTAQGSFEGSVAEIDVFETTGGSFDDPQATSTVNVGTMSLDFTDCSNAQLTYALTDSGAEGDIAITRVVPGGQVLCEQLAEVK